MTHKEWLSNEYDMWVKALGECTVDNFKEHPMVKRMLGEPDVKTWSKTVNEAIFPATWDMIYKIDHIGRKSGGLITGMCLRMMYYAIQVIKIGPMSILEIGGGVGQFYAILRALGYKDEYLISDIDDVEIFQHKYLKKVADMTGLDTEQSSPMFNYDLLVSFYALGEFDDKTKQHYKGVIKFCKHGYIAWNPHSGASDDLSIFDSHKITVTDGVEPGIKIIRW